MAGDSRLSFVLASGAILFASTRTERNVIMGILGSLFGWDQSMGAMNAVLASHLIENSNRAERQKIAGQVVKIISSVQHRQSADTILEAISVEPRVVQMNFIALACDNLGIAPPIRNNVWARVENPYRIGEQVDANRISAAIQSLEKQDGIRVIWPGNDARISFKRMYEEGLLR